MVEKYCDPCVMSALLAQLDAKDAQLADLRAIVSSPEKWQAWCDHRMLERAEAAEATLAARDQQIAALERDLRFWSRRLSNVHRLLAQEIERRADDLAALIASTPEDGR